jgi:hypothetical protein
MNLNHSFPQHLYIIKNVNELTPFLLAQYDIPLGFLYQRHNMCATIRTITKCVICKRDISTILGDVILCWNIALISTCPGASFQNCDKFASDTICPACIEKKNKELDSWFVVTEGL